VKVLFLKSWKVMVVCGVVCVSVIINSNNDKTLS
jgi:hypothetical protein